MDNYNNIIHENNIAYSNAIYTEAGNVAPSPLITHVIQNEELNVMPRIEVCIIHYIFLY